MAISLYVFMFVFLCGCKMFLAKGMHQKSLKKYIKSRIPQKKGRVSRFQTNIFLIFVQFSEVEESEQQSAR